MPFNDFLYDKQIISDHRTGRGRRVCFPVATCLNHQGRLSRPFAPAIKVAMILDEIAQKSRGRLMSRFLPNGLRSAGVPPAPSRRPADLSPTLPVSRNDEAIPDSNAFGGTPKVAVETTALPIPTPSLWITCYSSGNSAPDQRFRYETQSSLIKVNQGSRKRASFAPSVNSQLEGHPPCS
jgi:hypothetical protein